MSRRLRTVLAQLDSVERTCTLQSPLQRIDGRAKIIVTIAYLAAMLSLPLLRLSDLMLFALYPIVAARLCGIGFGTVLRRSLFVIPLAALVGLFNPIMNREIIFVVGHVRVTVGWVEFVSILLRGMLSVEAAVVLIASTGFYNVCRDMHRLGVPSVITTQLLLMYRYIFVLTAEALSMSQARAARGYGRKSYPLRMWGEFTGQLFLRSIARAERIERAMLARGFDGRIEYPFRRPRWTTRDTIYVVLCVACFAAVRFGAIAENISKVRL